MIRRITQVMLDEGGLVCEQHPHLPFEHDDDCAGPGMTRAQAIRDFGEENVAPESETWKP